MFFWSKYVKMDAWTNCIEENPVASYQTKHIQKSFQNEGVQE